MRGKLVIESKGDLTQEYLKEHFAYYKTSGRFIRIKGYTGWGKPRNCVEEIVSKNNRGYRWVRFHNQVFLVHRLIWLYVTGEHPTGEIDHINGDRLDNRWVNLRDVNAFENSRNQGNRIDNTSGTRGITFNLTSKKWVARISHRGVRYSLGYYSRKEDAIEARREAEEKFKYHPNHAMRESWRK